MNVSNLLLALLTPLVPLQDGQVPVVPVLPPAPDLVAPPLLASDGKPVAPGRVPDDATADARALWQKLFKIGDEGTPPAPVRSFDLAFDVRYREEGKNNNFEAHYRFLAERGWLRCEIMRSKRVQLRGPDGDYVIEKGNKIELRGREYSEDRRVMDDWVTIARNFLSLTNPGAMRIVSLRKVDAPDVELPDKARVQAAGLSWLEVKSPDFRLYRAPGTGRAEPVFRALLGLDAQTGETRIAILAEADAATLVVESTLLVEIAEWSRLGAHRVPRHLMVYRTRLNSSPWTFSARPETDLYLVGQGRLNPDLGADDFRN